MSLFDDLPADLDAQIACIEREIRMRERVYPRFVETGRMTSIGAEREIACMRAVLHTLRNVQQGRQS